MNVYFILVLILLGLILFIIFCKNKRENMGKILDKKITLVLGVPCIPEDIKLLPGLIKNINKQTRSPEKIIIALSETSSDIAIPLNNDLQKLSKIPILILNRDWLQRRNKS